MISVLLSKKTKMIFPPLAFVVVFSSVIIFCPVLSNPLNSCSVSCDSSSFCDSYENQCQPCSQLCEVTGDLGECGAKCPLYLHTVIHALGCSLIGEGHRSSLAQASSCLLVRSAVLLSSLCANLSRCNSRADFRGSKRWPCLS